MEQEGHSIYNGRWWSVAMVEQIEQNTRNG